MKKITVVSLFSGCGGLDYGFKNRNFQIIWANDNLKDACDSYKKNIGNHIVCDNIDNILIDNIPQSDLIIGGPPCQGFSGIGNRDPNDPRSELVWSFIRIIEKIKPSIFLFENVLGLKSSLSKDGSKVIENLSEAFKNIGYKLNIFILNSADYGVPQKRFRIFIVGNKLNIEINQPKQSHDDKGFLLKKWVTSFDAISDLGTPSKSGISRYSKKPDCEYQKIMRTDINKISSTHHYTPYASEKDKEIIKYVKPGGNYSDIPDEVATNRILYFKKTGGRTTTYGRLNPEKPNYTINTYFDRPNIGCNIHYKYNRMITIREGLRFQSFNDDFQLYSSGKRNFYVQVGNAVPPLVSKAWAEEIKRVFLKSKIM